MRYRLKEAPEVPDNTGLDQFKAEFPAHKVGKWGYRGVAWDAKRSLWRAYLCIDGKQNHLGYSSHPAGAASMYDIAARDHGLPLNFAPGAAQRFRWHTRYA